MTTILGHPTNLYICAHIFMTHGHGSWPLPIYLCTDMKICAICNFGRDFLLDLCNFSYVYTILLDFCEKCVVRQVGRTVVVSIRPPGRPMQTVIPPRPRQGAEIDLVTLPKQGQGAGWVATRP